MFISARIKIENDNVKLAIYHRDQIHEYEHYFDVPISPNADAVKIYGACVGYIRTFGRRVNGKHFISIRTKDDRLSITQSEAEQVRTLFVGDNIRDIKINSQGRRIL